eukprot:Em0017g395a
MFADKVISVNVTAVKMISVMVVMIAVLNGVMMSVKVNAVVKVISVIVMTSALIDVVIAVKVMVISVKVIVIAAIVTGELMNSVRVIAETYIVSMVMLKLTVAEYDKLSNRLHSLD